jgi:uncharacterized membrane protein
MNIKFFSQKNMIAIIIFSVVSAALGLVKIPGPAGSIALDSAPAFFAALYFSPMVGAVVGLVGHLGSALTGGWPLGGLHIYVAIEMFIWVLIFGFFASRHKTILILLFAGILAAILNGVIGTLLLTVTPICNLEWAFATKLIWVLLIAAIVNITLAITAYILIVKIKLSNL